MTLSPLTKNARWLFVVPVALCIWSLLLWQHFNGGVPSHYLLQRSDLPALSNWWGGLLLPWLTWWALGRIDARSVPVISRGVVAGFVGGLLVGLVLSATFVLGLNQITEWILPGLLLLALFFPIYRAECFLGFVLSMSYTFGALLPTGFSLVISLLAYVLFNYIRPIPGAVYRFLLSKS